MFNSRMLLAAIALVTISTASIPAQADLLALTFGPTVTANVNDGNSRNVGWEFTPTSNLTITSLGFYDAGSDGLSSAHAVGLYSFAGALLASTTVPAGAAGTLIDGFRFQAIAPISVLAGQTYIIDALILGSSDAWVATTTANPGVVVNSNIGVGGTGTARFNCCSETSLAFPASRIGDAFPGDQRNLFVGPNFQFSDAVGAVPEPSTWAMMLLGFAGLGLFGYRRRSMESTFAAA